MDAALITRWEVLCAVAVTCFSFSGALIMQMPRAERRTLFIFPIFLSVLVGGSLAYFGYERFGVWMIAGPVLVPIALVSLFHRRAPGWLLTMLSYVALVIAITFADFLLEAPAFR